MKKLILSFAIFGLTACGRSQKSDVLSAISKKFETLKCSNPFMNDGGYVLTFELIDGLTPRNVLVQERHRAGTRTLAKNEYCTKLSSYDSTLADGAQPQYQCIDPQSADGGFKVELTDGDRAGNRFANVFEISRRGTNLVEAKLECSYIE